MTTFIPRMTKARFPNRMFRPAGYTPDHQRLATVIAAVATILALIDWALTNLSATIGHLAFAAAVFGAARVLVGLSLTPRSLPDDDDTEATP